MAWWQRNHLLFKKEKFGFTNISEFFLFYVGKETCHSLSIGNLATGSRHEQCFRSIIIIIDALKFLSVKYNIWIIEGVAESMW